MQVQETTTTIQNIDMTDGVLAQQTLAGDQYAFERLVQRYSTPLFNFIYRFWEIMTRHVIFCSMYLSNCIPPYPHCGQTNPSKHGYSR